MSPFSVDPHYSAMTAQGALLPSTTAPPPPRSRHQRVDGRALVAFGKRGVRDLVQVAPARFLFPEGREGDFPLAVTVTTSGGLTGGDRLEIEIIVDPDVAATVVPQAAEKLYRALPDDEATHIRTRVRVGERGRCEWLGHEAILFDRSRMRRFLEVDLASDARLLAMEMLVLGRGAMGEVYREGLIHDSWRIRRDGRLVWADALHVNGDFADSAGRPFCFGPSRATATLVYAGPDAETFVELARTLVEGPDGGVTCFDNLLIVRMIREDPQPLRVAAMSVASALRTAIFGVTPTMPTICLC